MTAAELLADLSGQGFSLTAEGDRIGVRPASRLTEELRQAIRAHKPALLALLARAKESAPAFAWDEAEAERLLAQLREALARVEATVVAGEAPAARRAAMRTWLEVAEGFVNGREREAARGWDALALLRGATARALTLASPPAAGMPLTYARTARDSAADMTAVTPAAGR